MATCKQCREFEKCKDDAFINGAKFDPNESVEYCTGFEPITNSDRIRAMSDDELAVFLADEIDHGDCCGCKLECATYECDKFEDACHNAYYRWLKQPAE